MAMLLLWILSLAASFLLPATGEVVDSFDSCSQFFLDGKPPKLQPENPARICQKYMNNYRFATMYDRTRRIPMFSAYEYKLGSGQRQVVWKIEPQLVTRIAQASMEPEESYRDDLIQLRNSQAVSSDYNSKYAKPYNGGHLAPASHQPDQDSRDATFTITNIVPQFEQLNNGKWNAYEEEVRQYAQQCFKTYVIVGSVPGNTQLRSRVNIPSHIWAAVCCLLSDQTKQSWGVIAENNQNKVERFELKELESKLTDKYGMGQIDLFNGACY